jgi:hypothetical protein
MKIPIPTASARAGRRAVKTTAATLGVLLTFASVAPPFALAERDSEGEGAAPPGLHLPGLEEGPGIEPAGEETTLEVAPITPAEEVDEAPPMIEEPEVPAPVETEVVEPPTTATPAPVEAEVPAAPAPVEAAPAEQAAPVYEAAAPEPAYEPAAPQEPVRNEAIAAPAGGPEEAPEKQPRAPEAAVDSASTEVPVAVSPEPEPVEVPPASLPPSTGAVAPEGVRARTGSLGHREAYTVMSGDCLWTIAAAVLPAEASNSEIAAEVSRLWGLNAGRIGTGDPDVLLVGTVLRLR